MDVSRLAQSIGTTLKGQKCYKNMLSTKNLQKVDFTSLTEADFGHIWPVSTCPQATIDTQTPDQASRHIVACVWSSLKGASVVWWCFGVIWCPHMDMKKTWFCLCSRPYTPRALDTTICPQTPPKHSRGTLQRVGKQLYVFGCQWWPVSTFKHAIHVRGWSVVERGKSRLFDFWSITCFCSTFDHSK